MVSAAGATMHRLSSEHLYIAVAARNADCEWEMPLAWCIAAPALLTALPSFSSATATYSATCRPHGKTLHFTGNLDTCLRNPRFSTLCTVCVCTYIHMRTYLEGECTQMDLLLYQKAFLTISFSFISF